MNQCQLLLQEGDLRYLEEVLSLFWKVLLPFVILHTRLQREGAQKKMYGNSLRDEIKSKLERITVTFVNDRMGVAELPALHRARKNITKNRPKFDKTSLTEVQKWLLKAKADLDAEKKNTASNITLISKGQKNTRRAIQNQKGNKLAKTKTHKPEYSKPKDGTSSKKSSTKFRSGSSKMQLENLNTTKLLLEDSQKSTESTILEEWGMEGTMMKILNCIEMGVTPLNIKTLLTKAYPFILEFYPIIRAQCFASVLQLKQQGYIKISNDPATLEIFDIELGPKYDAVN